jgi:hypothetical protein
MLMAITQHRAALVATATQRAIHIARLAPLCHPVGSLRGSQMWKVVPWGPISSASRPPWRSCTIRVEVSRPRRVPWLTADLLRGEERVEDPALDLRSDPRPVVGDVHTYLVGVAECLHRR